MILKKLLIIPIIFILSANLFSQNSETIQLLDEQESLLLNLDSQIEELQNSFLSISTKADILAKDNEEIQNKLNAANTAIIELQGNLKTYKEALLSNKDDTAYIITLFADAQNQLDEINKKLVQQEKIINIQKKFIYIGIPTGIVLGIIGGSILSFKLTN